MTVYRSLNHVFGNLRDAFGKAMIEPGECKVIVEFSDERHRHAFVNAIRHSSEGPPMSGGSVGNFSGTWMGIKFEWRMRPDTSTRIERVARRIYGQSNHVLQWDMLSRWNKQAFRDMAKAAIDEIEGN